MIGVGELAQIQWREPWWLLLALQPLLLVTLRVLRGHRESRYADATLRPWVLDRAPVNASGWRWFRATANLLAWLLLAVAMAGPRLPLTVAGDAESEPGQLLVVVDTSRSMRAQDILPERLRRVRIELDELLARTGDLQVGVMVYAGRPHLLVPPTNDYAALSFYLDLLDALVLPTAGSRAAPALEAAREMLSGQAHAAVLWVTDGEVDAGEGDTRATLEASAIALAKAGIPLFVLGVGTEEGGAIPTGDGAWLEHEGRAVVSRMDAQALASIARLGRGAFSPVRADDRDWRQLYDEGIAAHLPVPQAGAEDILWQELYRWALLPALVLLLLVYWRPARRSGVAASMLALVLSMPIGPEPAHADELEQQAFQALASGRYEVAAELYARVEGFDGLLGEGVSLYRRGAYEPATARFGTAVLAARNDDERALALHNLGNSYFRLGDFAAATAAFHDALVYKPARETTRHNLALSEVLLETVMERLGESGGGSRPGSGPRTARAAEGLIVGETTTVMLDDEATANDHETPLIDPRQLPEELILLGIDRVRVLQAEGEQPERDVSRRQALAVARLRMQGLEDDQAVLWKQLFELEEGFVSSLDEPARMKGVTPW